MRRKVPTGKITPVAGAPLRLLVEYDNAADFIDDYAENLTHRQGVMQIERDVATGTQVQLGLSFPGLVKPIVIDAVVGTQADGAATRVELADSAMPRLAVVVERIRAGDRSVVVPVVRVLIADDNAHVCELVKSGLVAATRRELHDVAFDFETALDGGAARELLLHATFDAAIVAIYLPVLDGGALIRQIRTTLGLSQLPVIALSAGGDTARRAAMRAGASTVLDKPIRLRGIVETLRQLIAV